MTPTQLALAILSAPLTPERQQKAVLRIQQSKTTVEKVIAAAPENKRIALAEWLTS